MSQFGPVCCYECGSVVDDLYMAFSYMRSLLVKENKDVHVSKLILKSQTNHNADVIFEALGIPPERYCCRQRLLCTITPTELENM